MPADPKTLLPWIVFRRQTTDHVAEILDSLNIKVVKVPANLTHFFQLLRLNSQRVRKTFYEKNVCNLVCCGDQEANDAGVPEERIDVNLKLTSLEALHANSLIELYNVLVTIDGRETVLNGERKVVLQLS